MKILMPCDWKYVDLLTVENANDFGEALRSHCFIGRGSDTGCYSTFKVSEYFVKIEKGKIFDEAKSYLFENIDPTVYYCKYQNIFNKELAEIVIGWTWDGDGCLYFRFNDKAVVNTDCKCDYTWKFVK